MDIGRLSPKRPRCRGLPADVAADDDVAAHHGARRHLLVDGVRDDGGGHGELDGGRVHDADDVARAGGLEDAEERAREAVLGVQLDDLLVVVRALEELDARVERAAVGLEEHLNGVHRRIEGVAPLCSNPFVDKSTQYELHSPNKK
jgi:hypothetical protein